MNREGKYLKNPEREQKLKYLEDGCSEEEGQQEDSGARQSQAHV